MGMWTRLSDKVALVGPHGITLSGMTSENTKAERKASVLRSETWASGVCVGGREKVNSRQQDGKLGCLVSVPREGFERIKIGAYRRGGVDGEMQCTSDKLGR